MSEPIPPARAATSAADFLLWREVDRLDRRIDTERDRVSRLDEHGTRGVDGLRSEVNALRRDLIDHEELHKQAATDQKSFRRWAIGLLAGGLVALLSNPFLVYLLTR